MNKHDEFIKHHGVLGMKWGVRRYQNKDGTLTEAGKRRQFKKDRKELTANILKSNYPGQRKYNAGQKTVADHLAGKLLVQKYGQETVSKILRREDTVAGIKFVSALTGATALFALGALAETKF